MSKKINNVLHFIIGHNLQLTASEQGSVDTPNDVIVIKDSI